MVPESVCQGYLIGRRLYSISSTRIGTGPIVTRVTSSRRRSSPGSERWHAGVGASAGNSKRVVATRVDSPVGRGVGSPVSSPVASATGVEVDQSLAGQLMVPESICQGYVIERRLYSRSSTRVGVVIPQCVCAGAINGVSPGFS